MEATQFPKSQLTILTKTHQLPLPDLKAVTQVAEVVHLAAQPAQLAAAVVPAFLKPLLKATTLKQD